MVWLATSLVVSVLMAAFLFAATAIRNQIEQGVDLGGRYIFDGWYLIFLYGAYATGVLVIVVWVGRPVVSPIWRRIRSRFAKGTPT